MAGLIQEQMNAGADEREEEAQETPQQESQEPAEGAAEDITPEAVREKITVPPELQDAYERVVLAGMKMMFSEQTHELMLKEFERGGPIAKRLGEGTAGLLLLLFKQTNGNMPPQVLIPAGTDLLVQAADFVRKAGLEKVTNKDIGDGLEIMVGILFEKFGLSPEKVYQMVGGFDRSEIEQAAAGQEPAEAGEDEAAEAQED